MPDMYIAPKKSEVKIRKYYNMRVINKGERDCLRCSKVFFSEDLKQLKMCPPCRGLDSE